MKVLICLSSQTENKEIQKKFTEFGFVADMANTAMLLYQIKTGSYDALFISGNNVQTALITKLHTLTPQLPILVCIEHPLADDAIPFASHIDVIRKPFTIREATAKLLLLAHEKEQKIQVLQCKDIQLNIDTKEVRKGALSMRLPRKEFQMLEFLLRNKNRVVTRGQIHEYVWENDEDPMTNAIDVHISRLRKKFGGQIETAHGFGYMLKE